MDNIIDIKNIYYEYSGDNVTHVLNDFSLSIERGSFTVILGHNGSGKSTLAKLMNGLFKPLKGEVTVDGISTLDSEKEIEIKRRVGLVFQNPDNQLVSSIVEEDVAFGPENLGFSPQEIRNRVNEALKKVNMYDYRTSAPHNLSGGQKQRVAIAGVLAMTPECIVLDEPTAMLDPQGRKEVMEALVNLNKNHNITIVLITHFMDEAQFADRVIVMNSGNITGDDTPKQIFSQIKILKEAGLSIPQTTELLEILRNNGIDVPKGIISVDECVDVLNEILKSAH
ncbi:MAG: energy-coupling factor transporter ATPase [Acutalibacteraceae bacterium]|nr:energy-coupling factor transporter ATPase [Acutalibacteraceae bacterium]